MELFNDFDFVVSTFPVAFECFFPVLAMISVDTLSANVVTLECVEYNIVEPRTSQFMLNKIPHMSRNSSDLDNVQLSQIG